LQVVCLFFLDEFLEVSLLCPLSDDYQLVVVDKGVDVFDDVGVVQGLH
jgi:hypothetical protein